jgi:hypothetical protein
MSFGLGSKDLWKEDSLAHGTSVGKLCSLLSLFLSLFYLRKFEFFVYFYHLSVCVCVCERELAQSIVQQHKRDVHVLQRKREREQLQSLQKARAIYDEIMLLWGAVESTVHLCKVERN